MMMKVVFGGAATAAILAASAALAQTAPSPQPEQRDLPTKAATRADVQTHVSRFFSRVDTNKDGFVNKAELDALQAKRGDQIRSRGERREERFDRAKMFDRLDSNKDGMISRAEFDAAPPRVGMRHTGRHREFGGRTLDAAPTRAGVLHTGKHRGLGGRMLEMADVNKDGRVSLAEAQRTALQHFDQADLDHDGQLTREERRQSRQQLRSQRQPS